MKFIHYKPNQKKQLIALYFLIPSLLLVLAVITQPQRLLQFASAPPMFGCLQVGEGTNVTCGSLMGQMLLSTPFMLHDRPLEINQTVYYGDTLTGGFTFRNVGDLPIHIAAIGLVANAKNETYGIVMKPVSGEKTLTAKQSISVAKASYTFEIPDRSGEWKASTTMINSDGQSQTAESGSKVFRVDATCTALRVKPLTAKDKSNIKTLCKQHPDNKLCTSRQYCEIFEGHGPNCSKPNVSKEIPQAQCDEWVVLDKPEQDILEELCKVYPDTDACKDFCPRSLDSPLCPKHLTWVDRKTGQELIPQPKIIKEPQTWLVTNIRQTTVKGIQTAPSAKTEEQVAQDNAPGACVNGGAGFASCGTGTSAQRSTTGSTAPGAKPVPKPPPKTSPPKPKPAAAVPAPPASKPSGAKPIPLSPNSPWHMPGNRIEEIGSQACVETAWSQFFGSGCTPLTPEPGLPEGCVTRDTCYAVEAPRTGANAASSPQGKRPCSYAGSLDIEVFGTCYSARFVPGAVPAIVTNVRTPEGLLDPNNQGGITGLDVVPFGGATTPIRTIAREARLVRDPVQVIPLGLVPRPVNPKALAWIAEKERKAQFHYTAAGESKAYQGQMSGDFIGKDGKVLSGPEVKAIWDRHPNLSPEEAFRAEGARTRTMEQIALDKWNEVRLAKAAAARGDTGPMKEILDSDIAKLKELASISPQAAEELRTLEGIRAGL